jgi:hypothetical protein
MNVPEVNVEVEVNPLAAPVADPEKTEEDALGDMSLHAVRDHPPLPQRRPVVLGDRMLAFLVHGRIRHPVRSLEGRLSSRVRAGELFPPSSTPSSTYMW